MKKFRKVLFLGALVLYLNGCMLQTHRNVFVQAHCIVEDNITEERDVFHV